MADEPEAKETRSVEAKVERQPAPVEKAKERFRKQAEELGKRNREAISMNLANITEEVDRARVEGVDLLEIEPGEKSVRSELEKDSRKAEIETGAFLEQLTTLTVVVLEEELVSRKVETPQPSKTELQLTAERLSTEAVLAKLKPRRIEAEEGSHHTVYTFESKDGKPVEVLFYSPNELPLVEGEIKGKVVVINGDVPRWRTNEEWEDFSLKSLRASANAELAQQSYAQQVKEAIASGKGILLVEAGPEALLETAEQFGGELDEPLQEALSKLRERRLTEVSLEVVDSVLAGSLIDDKGKFRTEHQHEGEALYFLSLIGDKEAQQLLAEKKEVIQKADKKREMERKAKFVEQRRENEELGREALKLKDLVAVHTTRYLPQKGVKGLEILTTFEGSDWQQPRDTIHFALNHEVASHMYGSWENIPYIVIAPLEDMIESNGKPTVLNTVDTFWEIGPGKRLKLPEENTAIVQPGDLAKGEIISGVETNDVRYKASGLEPEDVAALSKELGDIGRDALNRNLLRIILNRFHKVPLDNQIKVSEEQEMNLVEVTGIFENRLNILGDLQEQTAEDVVRNILNMARIEVAEEQKEGIANELRGCIVANIKRLAVEKKIMQMGYKVHLGGMWVWDVDSLEAHQQTVALGAQLEVPVMAHEAHIGAKVEGEAIVGLSVLLNTESKPEAKERVAFFEDKRRHIREEFVPEISQDGRRMLYLTGVI